MESKHKHGQPWASGKDLTAAVATTILQTTIPTEVKIMGFVPRSQICQIKIEIWNIENISTELTQHRIERRRDRVIRDGMEERQWDTAAGESSVGEAEKIFKEDFSNSFINI